MPASIVRQPLPRAAAAQPSTPALPFVKWVGGKRRLLEVLRARLPDGMQHRRHVEMFAGGGALFFDRRPQRALLNDRNAALIEAYRAVRDEVEGVIGHLSRLAAQHHADSCSAARYYTARQRYNGLLSTDGKANPQTAERAALFIYLNKTCFNGLYRVNQQGIFNVPAGRYANPSIVDSTALRAASASLAGVELHAEHFDMALSHVHAGDFVYFDPPYEPASRTANFTSYTRDGFTQADQTRLRDIFATLDRRGCRLMLSNSDSPLIRCLYQAWDIEEVDAPRVINADVTKRGKVRELLVRNYS